jgi:hypothetical protein
MWEEGWLDVDFREGDYILFQDIILPLTKGNQVKARKLLIYSVILPKFELATPQI